MKNCILATISIQQQTKVKLLKSVMTSNGLAPTLAVFANVIANKLAILRTIRGISESKLTSGIRPMPFSFSSISRIAQDLIECGFLRLVGRETKEANEDE